MIIEALELARNFIKFNTGSSHYVIEQLDQAIADFEKQEPVAWPCVISEADFEKNTVILEMKCNDYQIKSGQHWLSPHPQPKREPLTHEQRVNLRIAFEPHKLKWNAQSILIDMVEAAHGIKENT